MSPHAEASCDLLLGLLAVQNELIDHAQLAAAFAVWTRAEGRPMAQILVEQGGLDDRSRALLETLVAEHPRLRGGSSKWDAASEGSGRPDGESAGQGAVLPSPATVTHVGATLRRSLDDLEPAPGALEGHRFQVLRPHARGGLGEVFLALDLELKREVALKELQADRSHDAGSQSRFLFEAEVTGRLEHPGIVPIYGLGRYADGRPFYAMRFIQGETLKQAIERLHATDDGAREPADRDLAFRRLLGSLVDACNAVAYAHSRGVVHRDLKPENIMLGPFGETLVLDWGIATTVSEPESPGAEGLSIRRLSDEAFTAHGAVIGTPQYMSPEQAAGGKEPVGPASDVYSLGATLYCLLAGRPPFPPGELRSVLRRVRRGIFPAPSRVRRSTDPALEAICLQAMALKAEDRHASLLALAADLEAWLANIRYRKEQELAVNQMKRSLARLCFERAQNLFGREMHPEGMLWLARALESVPPDSPGLERVIRASLGGWHAPTKLMDRRLRHGGPVHATAFSPDGRRLATASDDAKVRLWDLATGALLLKPLKHDAPAHAVIFSPDGRMMATASRDGAIRCWDAQTGQPFGGATASAHRALSLSFSSDGLLLAAVDEAGAFCVCIAETGLTTMDNAKPAAPVLAAAFAGDTKELITVGGDGAVRRWEATTGKSLGTLPAIDGAIMTVAFHPGGRALLAIGPDGAARIWDLERGSVLAEFTHRGQVCCVRFSPGGAAIATACDDGTARLWDAATVAPIGETLEHRTRVDCLEFSLDGTTVASGDHDGTVRIWDAATALPMGPPLRTRRLALTFSPDGQRLATGCADGMARCWKGATPIPGDAERIWCWARVSTGLELDQGEAIRRMDHLTAWELRRRLHELGGAPVKSH